VADPGDDDNELITLGRRIGELEASVCLSLGDELAVSADQVDLCAVDRRSGAVV
jgi:hypothetical protein